jgi:hypothetical protein
MAWGTGAEPLVNILTPRPPRYTGEVMRAKARLHA